jgi:hypothetical protein
MVVSLDGYTKATRTVNIVENESAMVKVSMNKASQNKPMESDLSKRSIKMNFTGVIGGKAVFEMNGNEGWYRMTYKGADPVRRTLKLVSFDQTNGKCVINAYLNGKHIGYFDGKVFPLGNAAAYQRYKGIFYNVKGTKVDFDLNNNLK